MKIRVAHGAARWYTVDGENNMSTPDTSRFPWKWSTMTDKEIRTWLLLVSAGRNPLDGMFTLAQADKVLDEFGCPIGPHLAPSIYMVTRSDGRGGVWWDFDAAVSNIRKYFPESAR